MPPKQKGKCDRWVAYIYFKGQRYHLGTFKEYDDAVAAREEAERKYFSGMLE